MHLGLLLTYVYKLLAQLNRIVFRLIVLNQLKSDVIKAVSILILDVQRECTLIATLKVIHKHDFKDFESQRDHPSLQGYHNRVQQLQLSLKRLFLIGPCEVDLKVPTRDGI